MEKKGILYGRGFEKGRLRELMWGVVLLCYTMLLSPFSVWAETCTAGIDYNKPTIAAGWGYTAGIREDGTVVAGAAQLEWTNIKSLSANNL